MIVPFMGVIYYKCLLPLLVCGKDIKKLCRLLDNKFRTHVPSWIHQFWGLASQLAWISCGKRGMFIRTLALGWILCHFNTLNVLTLCSIWTSRISLTLVILIALNCMEGLEVKPTSWIDNVMVELGYIGNNSQE